MNKSFNASQYNRVILGVDPGTNVMGFAIIAIKGTQLELIAMGSFNARKMEDHLEKLKKMSEELTLIIDQYKPDELAIEAPFFGKNVQSMLKLGRAQGVAMTIAITKGLHITEYSPKKIKQSITGNGNASKEQVAGLLQHILGRSLEGEVLDATDALAVAVAHHFQRLSPTSSKKKSGWGDFIKDNPDKVSGL
jgi:crossover junction endodeoxyribonuclease RuvC